MRDQFWGDITAEEKSEEKEEITTENRITKFYNQNTTVDKLQI